MCAALWYDLLFAHWPVPAAALRRLVPDRLTVQEHGGTSWVGVVPFRMAGVMRRPLPDLPWVSAFPELNVRLYVERDGKPGVWFLSLDAANPLAVWAARRFFHLPYHRARMAITPDGDGFRYESRRPAAPEARFTAAYRPSSERLDVRPGSLESFQTERYCLYARSPAGRWLRGQVHHGPWPLHRAEAEIDAAALLAAHGLVVEGPPVLHFSPGVSTVLWPFERLT